MTVRAGLSKLMGFCLMAVSMAGSVMAQFSGQSVDEVVEVRLLEGWRVTDTRHMAAVRITLAPGWKTYWRAPGEGGLPTRLRMDPMSGVESVDIHWPRPEVFSINGMRSIGYGDEVILPLEFHLSETGAVEIDGQIDMGVCLDVCIPVTLQLEGLLPPTGERHPQIAAALADQPLSAREAGAGEATCQVTPISDGLRVEARMQVPQVGDREMVVFELPNASIWISETTSRRDGNTVTAVADVVPADAGPFAMNRSDLRITVLGSRMAVELLGCTG